MKQVITLNMRATVDVPQEDVIGENGLDIYPWVEKRGFFSFQLRGGVLKLSAGAYVGLIPLNDKITIDVRPRISPSNYGRVLDVSQQRLTQIERYNRQFDSGAEGESSFDFLVRNFLSSLHELSLHGRYKTYRTTHKTTDSPRGRIDIQRTLTQCYSKGMQHRVCVEWFEHTENNPFNRVLKAALTAIYERYRRNYLGSSVLRTELSRYLLEWESIPTSDIVRDARMVAEMLRRGALPASRLYYTRSLAISLFILNRNALSLEEVGSDIELSGFIIDFESVFEAYVLQLLKANIAGSDFHVGDGNRESGKPLFEDQERPRANPDIVISKKEGEISLIVEVKYKPKFNRADLNQVITYALSYKSNDALIVHGSEKPDNVRYEGLIGGIRIWSCGIALGLDDLLQEEQRFIDLTRDLIFHPEKNSYLIEAD